MRMVVLAVASSLTALTLADSATSVPTGTSIGDGWTCVAGAAHFVRCSHAGARPYVDLSDRHAGTFSVTVYPALAPDKFGARWYFSSRLGR